MNSKYKLCVTSLRTSFVKP